MGFLHNHVVTFARDFCVQQRPGLNKKEQLQELLMEYQHRLSPDDLKTVCSLLASNVHVPKSLIVALCNQPANICRPLLLASGILTTDDFIEIIEAKGLAHARIISRRTDKDPALIQHLRKLGDERIYRALELRQPPMHQSPNKAPASKNIQLHQIDLALDEKFSHLAKECDIRSIHNALVVNLSLELVSVQNLCSNLTSRNLPVAFHYLRLSTQAAWQVFACLAQPSKLSADVYAQFVATYESLDFSLSVATVKAWQKDDLRAQEIYSQAANQSNLANVKKLAS